MAILKIAEKTGFFIRRLGIILGAAVFITALAEGIRAATQTRAILIGPPYTLVAGMFAAGGGEQKLEGFGRTLIGSLGGTGIAKMEGSDFKLGTGVVGGVGTSGIDINNAHAFPNPYIPSKGHNGITFSQLTAEASVRIYTITGALVQELFKTDEATDRVAWFPVANKQGNPIASGVYVFVVESGDGQMKTGKIMVIK